MRKDIPEGVLPMLSIPGLRPDKVLKVHRELGVASLDELEQAARQDRLRAIKGLGPALQCKIGRFKWSSQRLMRSYDDQIEAASLRSFW